MTTTAGNVRVGVTGAIYGAPSGTTLPTNATASLNAAFEEFGYVSEDGVTEAQGTNTNDIKAWQNGDIVRKIQTSHDLTYQFAFLETNDQVLDAFYGSYTNGTVQITGTQPDTQAWVIQVVDAGHLIRIVIPAGQVTERGDVQYVNGDAIMYQVTVTAYPDANGVKAYVYFLGAGS